MEEQWRAIDGYHGKYFISSFGRLKSINGSHHKKYPDGYITTGGRESFGYRYVGLRLHGKLTRYRIHRLVALAFIPNPESKPEVNHIDSNPENNHISNLEWVNHKENIQHAINGGRLNNKGSNHGLSKLTIVDVLSIRHLKEQGLLHKEISAKFNISTAHVSSILKGRSWGWLKGNIKN